MSLAVPLLVLYEGSIWSVKIVERKAKAAPAARPKPPRRRRASRRSDFCRLTQDPYRIIFIGIPLRHQGAFHERHETRGGERWPLRASRRGARGGGPSRGIPPGSRSGHQRWIATLSPPGANTEQASHTARGTPTRLAVRGDYARVVLTLSPHGAAGWPKARRSARPWQRGQEGNGGLDDGAPGAAKNTGSGALASHFVIAGLDPAIPFREDDCLAWSGMPATSAGMTALERV